MSGINAVLYGVISLFSGLMAISVWVASIDTDTFTKVLYTILFAFMAVSCGACAVESFKDTAENAQQHFNTNLSLIALIVFKEVECIPSFIWLLVALILGFISYGLSINFYIMAQKNLGAAKTSAYYSIAPFLGVFFSLLLVGERPGVQFYVALVVLVVGTILIVKDTLEEK